MCEMYGFAISYWIYKALPAVHYLISPYNDTIVHVQWPHLCGIHPFDTQVIRKTDVWSDSLPIEVELYVWYKVLLDLQYLFLAVTAAIVSFMACSHMLPRWTRAAPVYKESFFTLKVVMAYVQ